MKADANSVGACGEGACGGGRGGGGPGGGGACGGRPCATGSAVVAAAAAVVAASAAVVAAVAATKAGGPAWSAMWWGRRRRWSRRSVVVDRPHRRGGGAGLGGGGGGAPSWKTNRGPCCGSPTVIARPSWMKLSTSAHRRRRSRFRSDRPRSTGCRCDAALPRSARRMCARRRGGCRRLAEPDGHIPAWGKDVLPRAEPDDQRRTERLRRHRHPLLPLTSHHLGVGRSLSTRHNGREPIKGCRRRPNAVGPAVSAGRPAAGQARNRRAGGAALSRHPPRSGGPKPSSCQAAARSP